MSLTHEQLIDAYFIENRTKLLDIAAFLDRLDRSDPAPGRRDFRIAAFDQALQMLGGEAADRVKQIQVIFSDPTQEPLETLEGKSARGAYEPRKVRL